MIDLHAEILSTNGQPQFAVLPYHEFLQVKAARARLIEKEMEDPRYGSFYDNLTAEELARRQGVKPVESIEQLYGTRDPDDWGGLRRGAGRMAVSAN